MSHPLPAMRKITDDLSACAQLTQDDIKALSEQGVKTLICNRPDDEEPEQPSSASLKAYAEELGLQWFYLPVISGQVEDGQGDEFGQILAQAKTPIVAFCRSGARCGMLWALSQRKQQDPKALVDQLKVSGYDMPDFFARLMS
ncbi:TIGR01244 family sulfur transferase [Nitrincola schmidtii]|uniref:TIGR01244 family sulfur transferase n=1 Tax=Nitrincola schmidtii TaxID=1730894 RepID=UPI00124DED34|nr:TIGR01244 family sulfur transferase [Nitrincola schmidtii]